MGDFILRPNQTYFIRSASSQDEEPASHVFLALTNRSQIRAVEGRPDNIGQRRWIIEGPDSRTTYRIVCVDSVGRVFLGSSPSSGSSPTEGTAQGFTSPGDHAWSIDRRGNAYVISYAENEMALELSANNQVTVRPRKATNNQRWVLTPVTSLNTGASPLTFPSRTHNMYRKPGVLTDRLVIYNSDRINLLPYGVRLMRDGDGEQSNSNAPNANIILRLVASLRDSIVNMPPVFRYGNTMWGVLRAFHGHNAGQTFIFTMHGLVELASCIPGSNIDFSVAPTMEPLRVVTEAGEDTSINLWHAGVRCVAYYCLAIVRALPEGPG